MASGAMTEPSTEAGFSWTEFIDDLVGARGSLAAVAMHLARARSFSEDVASVERGLRRLRTRGARDGGVWGQRALRCFGLPSTVNDRIRWMGQYHTRFSDLPASLCEELIRPWDRPPISESPTRVWIDLARVGLALRRRDDPVPPLSRAEALDARAELAAQIELALVGAYVWARRDRARAQAALTRARDLLEHADTDRLGANDYACLFARWIDQVAYPLNKPPPGSDPDHAAAVALYERIPEHGPPFAQCRRENGLGWSWLLLGQLERAQAHARASMEAAGDSGSLRMRAMALNLFAATEPDESAARARERARAIARRLEDEALLLRFRARD